MFNKEGYLKMDETICPVCGNHHFEEKKTLTKNALCVAGLMIYCKDVIMTIKADSIGLV